MHPLEKSRHQIHGLDRSGIMKKTINRSGSGFDLLIAIRKQFSIKINDDEKEGGNQDNRGAGTDIEKITQIKPQKSG